MSIDEETGAEPYVPLQTAERAGGGMQDFDAIKAMKFAASRWVVHFASPRASEKMLMQLFQFAALNPPNRSNVPVAAPCLRDRRVRRVRWRRAETCAPTLSLEADRARPDTRIGAQRV